MLSLRSLENVGKVGIEKNGRALNDFYIVKKVRFVIFQLNYLYLGLKIGVDFFIKWELMQLGVLLISKMLVWKTWNPKMPPIPMNACPGYTAHCAVACSHEEGKRCFKLTSGFLWKDIFERMPKISKLILLTQFRKRFKWTISSVKA